MSITCLHLFVFVLFIANHLSPHPLHANVLFEWPLRAIDTISIKSSMTFFDKLFSAFQHFLYQIFEAWNASLLNCRKFSVCLRYVDKLLPTDIFFIFIPFFFFLFLPVNFQTYDNVNLVCVFTLFCFCLHNYSCEKKYGFELFSLSEKNDLFLLIRLSFLGQTCVLTSHNCPFVKPRLHSYILICLLIIAQSRFLFHLYFSNQIEFDLNRINHEFLLFRNH